MGIFNKKKQIIVYALISKSIENKFLTISENRLDAYEYAMAFMRLQHQNHFDTWCELRQLDKDDINNWLQYYDMCIEDDEKNNFQVVKVRYNVKDVVTILRMFGNCFPLGCSFDTEIEKEYFKAVLNGKVAESATKE